jgi:Ca2+-binding RTX toxin-like protein
VPARPFAGGRGLARLAASALAILAVAGVAQASAAPVRITGVEAFPNARFSGDRPALAADGNPNTFTWTTEVGNVASPSYLAVFFDRTRVHRLRLWKLPDGGGGENVKNLVIQYTTTPQGGIPERTWTNVRDLGVGGGEVLRATAVNPDGTVTGDVHDSSSDGFASLIFEPVEATGIRIGFSNPDAGSLPPCSGAGNTACNHYRVGEIAVYSAPPTCGVGNRQFEATIEVAPPPPERAGLPTITFGTPGTDVIVGTDGPDVILGRGGVDYICGRGGADTINGGPGEDGVFGEGGADVLNGGGDDSADLLLGGDGPDRLSGGPGGDKLRGENGRDIVRGGDGDDRLDGGDEADVLFGGADQDELVGGPGADHMDGGPGGDVLVTGDGADRLDGGGGRTATRNRPGAGDLADFRAAPRGVNVDLKLGIAGTGEAVIRLIGIDDVRGTDFNDSLSGNPRANIIEGRGGVDSIIGRGGPDRLFGEDENDRLDGGDGFDDLFGGSGRDTCENGERQRSCEETAAGP